MNDKNQNFVNNKETFNKRIFDRNLLSSQLSSVQNQNPSYFSENYRDNRNNSEELFKNRFESNIYNLHMQPRIGVVDFNIPQNDNKNVEFKGIYIQKLLFN